MCFKLCPTFHDSVSKANSPSDPFQQESVHTTECPCRVTIGSQKRGVQVQSTSHHQRHHQTLYTAPLIYTRVSKSESCIKDANLGLPHKRPGKHCHIFCRHYPKHKIMKTLQRPGCFPFASYPLPPPFESIISNTISYCRTHGNGSFTLSREPNLVFTR